MALDWGAREQRALPRLHRLGYIRWYTGGVQRRKFLLVSEEGKRALWFHAYVQRKSPEQAYGPPSSQKEGGL